MGNFSQKDCLVSKALVETDDRLSWPEAGRRFALGRLHGSHAPACGRGRCVDAGRR